MAKQFQNSFSKKVIDPSIVVQHYQARARDLKAMSNGIDPDFYLCTFVPKKSNTINRPFNSCNPIYNDVHPDVLWKMWTGVYARTCRQVIGCNYHRKSKRHLQPMSYSAICAGHCRLKGFISTFDPDAYDNPHTHSIMMTHPITNGKFHNLLVENIATTEIALYDDPHLNIKSLDIKKIPPSDLQHVWGYSSKFVRRAPPNIDKELLWQIYPFSVTE